MAVSFVDTVLVSAHSARRSVTSVARESRTNVTSAPTPSNRSAIAWASLTAQSSRGIALSLYSSMPIKTQWIFPSVIRVSLVFVCVVGMSSAAPASSIATSRPPSRLAEGSLATFRSVQLRRECVVATDATCQLDANYVRACDVRDEEPDRGFPQQDSC